MIAELLNLGRFFPVEARSFPVELFCLATGSDKSRHRLSSSAQVRGYFWRLSFESGRSGAGLACLRRRKPGLARKLGPKPLIC